MIFFLLFISTFCEAAVSPELAKRLVEMRGAVEEAGNNYEESLRHRKQQLEPLQQHHSELEAQIAKEELKNAQLKAKLKLVNTSPNKKNTSKAEEWLALQKWSAQLNSYIEASIPFRRKERLERSHTLQEKITKRRESPITMAAELWTLTEKELGLTKDIEYRIGKLPLAQGELDGEMARLGMAHMLYLSASGQAGYSVQKDGHWQLSLAQNADEKADIERLISRLKNKSANGWYKIPGLASISREDRE